MQMRCLRLRKKLNKKLKDKLCRKRNVKRKTRKVAPREKPSGQNLHSRTIKIKMMNLRLTKFRMR